jgi:RNA polymerase sigma-70 factor, ECF subfamily
LLTQTSGRSFWNFLVTSHGIRLSRMTWSEKIRDRAAFTALYHMHEPAVYRFALSMSGDPVRASEITQDVFIWLIRHPNSFDPARGELGAFLIGVARKFLMRRSPGDARLVPLDESQHSIAVTPATEREEDEQIGVVALRAAVAALPERYRAVIVLCDLEGRTYEEAAAALECATGTVRSRLHRARQFLGRKLQSIRRDQGCIV